MTPRERMLRSIRPQTKTPVRGGVRVTGRPHYTQRMPLYKNEPWRRWHPTTRRNERSYSATRTRRA